MGTNIHLTKLKFQTPISINKPYNIIIQQYCARYQLQGRSDPKK
jgi:hypothetical protein